MFCNIYYQSIKKANCSSFLESLHKHSHIQKYIQLMLQLRGLGNKDLFRLICLLHFVQIQSFCWTKLGGTAHADCASTTCRPHDTPTIQTPYKDINMTIKRHNTLYCVKYLYIITVHLFNRY